MKRIDTLKDNQIFVFGSNANGNHAGGAARQAERVSRWLDVMIRGKGITIRPLQNIREFYEEGEAMHHCVFTCGYYKKDGILVLTARKAGVRLETIEVDTTKWRILQCRGRFNKDSAHHKEIVSLMEKNMNRLRQATA